MPSGRTLSISPIRRKPAASIEAGIANDYALARDLVAVHNVRGGIGKSAMIHNDSMPFIEVDAETYEVRADGELLRCEPADTLPFGQRYFLF